MWRRVHLSPTTPDLAVARTITRHVSPPVERCSEAVTYLADERVLLAAATLVCGVAWLTGKPATRRASNYILACTAASAVVPHVLKLFFERERPDRRVAPGFRHGIPRSGRPFDSFPSGHALHLGALAAASARLGGRRWSRVAWSGAIGLASTRIFLLAHWLTDVAAGLVLGVALDWTLARVSGFSLLRASAGRSSTTSATAAATTPWAPILRAPVQESRYRCR
jgi:undecaprenyl-diphosphatase